MLRNNYKALDCLTLVQQITHLVCRSLSQPECLSMYSTNSLPSFPVSSDGYPYTYLPLSRYYPQPPNENGWANLAESPTTDQAPVVCTISHAECFNNNTESESAVEMFKHVMLDKPTCGDCCESGIIVSLSQILTLSLSSPPFSYFCACRVFWIHWLLCLPPCPRGVPVIFTPKCSSPTHTTPPSRFIFHPFLPLPIGPLSFFSPLDPSVLLHFWWNA